MSISVYNYSVTGDCSNSGVGAIYFDITGTSSPFSVFETAPTTGYFPTSGTTTLYSVTGIPAGEYSITITDASFSAVTYPIYISSGTCVSIDSENTSCGDSNGSITAITQNVYLSGADFYLYDINDNLIDSATNVGATHIFPFLSAGTYYVVGDDGGGCTGKSESCIVKSSTTFTYGTYVINDSNCESLLGTGKIYVTGQTGNPPYTYSWLPGGEPTSFITGLTNGVYTVTVTDSNGCSISQNAVVTTASAPNIVSFTTTSPSCFSNDGEVEVLVVGGTPPYYFSGSNGYVEVTFSNTITFTGLSSGILTVMVTDAGLCTDIDSVELITPNGFSVVSITTTNSNCNNNDGSIDVLINAGSPSGTFTYVLIDSSGNTVSINTAGVSNTFPSVPSGNYTVEVSNGTCIYTGTTTVSNTNLFTITASTTGTTCGLNNGSIHILASSGGTLPYTYEVTGFPSGPVSSFNNLSQGFYNIIVTDAGGCSQTETVYITGSVGVYFDFFNVQPLVGNDGELSALITSGVPPFTLNWSPNVNGQTGTTVTGLTAGTYSLQVIDNNGCSFTRTTTLNGTTLFTGYEIYNVCADKFRNTGVSGRRGVLQMFNEGYFDLTSGDTGCILNSATFTADVTVNGVNQQSIFYTASTMNDYPTDEEWVTAITDLLYSFSGITSVVANIETNQIIIKSGCITGGTACQPTTINQLDDANVVINLIINYDISCVFCGGDTKIFQDDVEFLFMDNINYVFQ